MENIGKHFALVLICLILWILVDKREKDISMLLTLAAGCGVMAVAAAFLRPVLELIWQLETLGQLGEGLLKGILKAVGIAFLSETVGNVCLDAGNSSLGCLARLLGSCMMLHVSIPVFSALISLIQDILGVL